MSQNGEGWCEDVFVLTTLFPLRVEGLGFSRLSKQFSSGSVLSLACFSGRLGEGS